MWPWQDEGRHLSTLLDDGHADGADEQGDEQAAAGGLLVYQGPMGDAAAPTAGVRGQCVL